MRPGLRRPRRRDALLASAAALLAAVAPASVLVVAPTAHSQGLGVARESAVKAAFLHKFGGFVDWPANAFTSATEPLVIAVHGDEAVASELEQLTQGRRVEGRTVTVRRVREPGQLGRPHILFVGGGRESRMRELLAAVRGPVLTVSDGPVTGEPAVLHFTTVDGRVRFGASLDAATQRGLRLSAKLLAVAQNVEGR